jgi:hypothetical protein
MSHARNAFFERYWQLKQQKHQRPPLKNIFLCLPRCALLNSALAEPFNRGSSGRWYWGAFAVQE